MSLSNFISEVKTRGLARTNRYTVQILDPADPDSAKLAQLFCESASLPSINMNTTPYRIYGESREMPYERGFDPVTLTFYVDAEMKIKKMFDSWINSVMNPVTRQMGYYKMYTRDIKIEVFDVSETLAPYSITLCEAYPKNIGTVQLDYNSKDVMKLPVTITYKYWKYSDSTVSPAESTLTQDSQSVNTSTGFTYDDFGTPIPINVNQVDWY